MGSINYIKKLFHAMIARVNQHQNQPSAQRPGVPQGAAAVQQQTNPATNMPALNATNLQQLQQQEEALQRARRAASQTANTIPQAPFGAPSPSGVPHAYGPGGFPPEKLKIPPNKKRKQSHPGSTAATPVQAQGPGLPASKAQAGKQAAAQAKPSAPVVGGPFKCSVVECQHHFHGFTTQNALDKHVEVSHKAEEPIENALEFALDSFRTSLVKENEGAEGQEPKKILATATDNQRALNKLATATPPTKEGTTPAATGATPMGRVPSHVGPKSTSPASNQQLTPQFAAGKTPTPSAFKPTGAKGGKKEAEKPVEQAPSGEDAATKDPWVDSTISLDAIHDAFMDFRDDGLHGLGVDPMDEFLNSEMFINAQSKDTPDSVDTGVTTQTPKDNEALKGDVDVKIAGVSDDGWMPADWANVPNQFEGDLLMNDTSFDDIDWGSLERKDAEISIDDGSIPIFAI